MTPKANKLKSNSLKTPPVEPEIKKGNNKTEIKKKSGSASGKSIHLSDPRIAKALGFFLVFFSLYLFFAFTSYLINWFDSNPGSIFMPADSVFFKDHAEIVETWTGRLGSFLSEWFIFNGIGLGAYLITLGLFALGMRLLLKISMIKFWIWVELLVLLGLWMPSFMNLVFPSHPENILGGLAGHQLNIWLISYLGNVGLIMGLIFVLAIFLIIHFSFLFDKSFFTKFSDQAKLNKQKSVQNEDLYNTVEFSVEDEEDHEEDFISSKKKAGTNEYKILIDDRVVDHSPDDDFEPIDPAVKINTEDIELTIEHPVEENKHPKLAPGTHFGVDTEFDPTLDLPDYKMPPLDLLEDYDSGNVTVDKDELEANKNRIVETLQHYAINITKIKATIGPTVTLYEIVPAPGVRISRIKNLEDDIALSLSAMGIRIIAPIPGKGTVGIEVPNRNPTIVSMKSIFSSEKFRNNTYDLPFGIGKTISNESFVADLAKMPHVLMAGATGQGKSVGLNAIIASLLYKKHPAELKFILVDPKKVELTLFSRIERHFLAKLPDSEEAIITDTRKVVRTLNSLSIEMDNRYELLKDAQVRNIKEYNKKFISRKLSPLHGHRYLPYLVLVIDEFADLIMTAGKEIESPITRLAQLARAVGIHLIIATQRPSVNIITGTIKANFPARIAFRVISKIDSRTILDSSGADQLVGRGDMLFSTGSDLIRLQCAFIDTPEVEKLTSYIGAQRGYSDALHLPEFKDEENDTKADVDPSERDELFEDAALIIVQTQQGSTSLLQRKLKLGYNRAGRIIDQLEAAGIVGPFEGSKAREVKVGSEMALEQYLKDLHSRETPQSDF
ncbi:MAG: cell division protein FtsK [Bacteroidetes bacterium HGW-Bacteroidetes-16]|jgi:S-DNA-T family DNA segregation ATPase FtsK/SpoIIIE|nr:MAG: cell division protein FtsK [Bacteroidetes bacterium HGW-Bacteroidetes-16]